MNAQHPAKLTPSWYGDSVGHYEGDTLVIDTVGIKVGPFAMVDWYGTPHSPAAARGRTLSADRLRRSAKEGYGARRERKLRSSADFRDQPELQGKLLQLLFTVDDPDVFTTPWSATVTYRRIRLQDQWLENVCAENPRKYGTEKDAQVPTAKAPDF